MFPRRTPTHEHLAHHSALLTFMESAFMKFTHLFQSPSSRQVLQLDRQVSELSNVSAEIEDHFHWVKERLELIVEYLRAREKKGANGIFQSADVEDYLEKWKAYHGKCVDLLWGSRQVAGKIQAASAGFSHACDELLSNTAAQFEENRLEIADCAKLLEEHEKSASRICQEFNELRRGVKSFQVRWETFVEEETQGKSLNSSEANLLHGFKGNFGDLTLKIGVTSSAFGLLTAITGSVSRFTNKTSNQVGGAGSTPRAKDVIRQINPEADAHFYAICSRLAVLCNLWATVSADIRAVGNSLIVLGYNDKLDDRSKKRLVRIRDSYEKLGSALYRYQTEVIS